MIANLFNNIFNDFSLSCTFKVITPGYSCVQFLLHPTYDLYRCNFVKYDFRESKRMTTGVECSGASESVLELHLAVLGQELCLN